MKERFKMPGQVTADHGPERPDWADANENWEWIRDVMSRLGLVVMVIESNTNPQKADWPHIGRLVGAKLEIAAIGTWDSAKIAEVSRWWFYVRPERLAEAIAMAKDVLERWKVLSLVKIGHADAEAGVWRTIHPGLQSHS